MCVTLRVYLCKYFTCKFRMHTRARDHLLNPHACAVQRGQCAERACAHRHRVEDGQQADAAAGSCVYSLGYLCVCMPRGLRGCMYD